MTEACLCYSFQSVLNMVSGVCCNPLEMIMNSKLSVFILFVSIVVSASAAFSYDHVRYVDVDNGDDANSGLSSGVGAWENLFFAVNQINGDDSISTSETIILYVAAGTYSASMSVAGTNNIIIQKSNLTIKGVGASTTLLDGTGSDTGYWYDGIIISSIADNITIRDIKIANFAGSGINILSGTGHSFLNCEISGNINGFYVANGSVAGVPVIEGNTIKDNSYGIQLDADQNNVSPLIKGNIISSNTSTGIYISTNNGESNPEITGNTIDTSNTGILGNFGSSASSPKIYANRLYDNSNAIYLTAGGGVVSSPEIINNVIYKTTGTMTNGILLYGSSTPGSTINATIYHNTITGGTDNGIFLDAESGTITSEIKYTIISDFTGGSTSYGILNTGGAATLTIDYVNVWNTGTGRCQGCPTSFDLDTDNLNVDPVYASDYSIQVTSPCIDTIPDTEGDPVVQDLIGTSRPRKQNSSGPDYHDIGAYEYPYKSYDFTMPGGTGTASDYRLMTLPVQVGTSSLATAMTTLYGSYDTKKWRLFAWYNDTYVEMTDAGFDDLALNSQISSYRSIAFWLISLNGAFGNNTLTFEGALISNMQPTVRTLEPGWNLIALPWPASTENPSIELGKIVVRDTDNSFWVTSTLNTLTDPVVWDYTGSGYVQMNQSTDLVVPGKGYWINVTSASQIEFVVPPDNGNHFTAEKRLRRESIPPGPPRYFESPPSPPVSSGKNAFIDDTGNGVSVKGSNGCFINSCYSQNE